MSLSKLERDAVLDEERRVVVLRERERAKAQDATKLRRQTKEELDDHARFCVKGMAYGRRQPYQAAGRRH
jgi:hypothetical protein